MKTRQEIKAEAKKILAAHRSEVSIYYVIWSLVCATVMIVLSLAAGLLGQFSASASAIAAISVIIAIVAALAPMMFSFYDYPLRLIKGEPVSLSMLWSGWKSANYVRSLWVTLRYIGWMVLLYLVVFVPLTVFTLVSAFAFGYSLLGQTSVPGVSVQAIVADEMPIGEMAAYNKLHEPAGVNRVDPRPSTVSILLVFLLIILIAVASCLAFMWLDATYSQAYFIITGDQQTTAGQAVALAKTLMKGHRWQYIVFTMSFWGWALLAALISGVINYIIGIAGLAIGTSGVMDSARMVGQLSSAAVTAYLMTSYLMTAKAVYFRELVAENSAAAAQSKAIDDTPTPAIAAASTITPQTAPQDS